MTGRARLILVIVIGIFVCLVIYLFFIRSRQSELADIRDQIAAEESNTLALQAELSRLQALQDDAPRLQAQLEEIRRLVPQRPEVPNFIFQVQEAANSAGLDFLQITPTLPKQPPEGAALAEVRITLRGKGGYFSVQDFIRRLYDLDRALRIDSVTMTASEEATARTDTTVISRIFFELPPPAPVPGAPVTGVTPAPTPTAP